MERDGLTGFELMVLAVGAVAAAVVIVVWGGASLALVLAGEPRAVPLSSAVDALGRLPSSGADPAAAWAEPYAPLAQSVRSTLTLRPSTYRAFDPHRPSRRISFTSRFALRYGTGKQADESARLPEIRAAFNSPFWPWVLATTSAGQEGIDFHWWCHAIVHWNTPPNPVDFEQREGRVNRYSGLAIRKNLAHRHRVAILGSASPNPWDAAYELGLDECERLGELAPHWVYPGPAKIHRTMLPFPLSTDAARYRRLKDDLALYRLTFGQPRQEDLLEILKRRGVQHDPERADELRLRLHPPAARGTRT